MHDGDQGERRQRGPPPPPPAPDACSPLPGSTTGARRPRARRRRARPEHRRARGAAGRRPSASASPGGTRRAPAPSVSAEDRQVGRRRCAERQRLQRRERRIPPHATRRWRASRLGRGRPAARPARQPSIVAPEPASCSRSDPSPAKTSSALSPPGPRPRMSLDEHVGALARLEGPDGEHVSRRGAGQAVRRPAPRPRMTADPVRRRRSPPSAGSTPHSAMSSPRTASDTAMTRSARRTSRRGRASRCQARSWRLKSAARCSNERSCTVEDQRDLGRDGERRNGGRPRHVATPRIRSTRGVRSALRRRTTGGCRPGSEWTATPSRPLIRPTVGPGFPRDEYRVTVARRDVRERSQ